MLEAARSLNVNIGNIFTVKLTFFLSHLIPLSVMPVTGVDFAKGLHREEKYKLEVSKCGTRPGMDLRSRAAMKRSFGVIIINLFGRFPVPLFLSQADGLVY